MKEQVIIAIVSSLVSAVVTGIFGLIGILLEYRIKAKTENSINNSTKNNKKAIVSKKSAWVKRIAVFAMVFILVFISSFLLISVIKRKASIVHDKKIEAYINDEPIDFEEIIYITAGSKITFVASPSKELIHIEYQVNDDPKVIISDSIKASYNIPLEATIDNKYSIKVNALYSDGLYLNDKEEPSNSNDTYLFMVDSESVQGKKISIYINGEELKSNSLNDDYYSVEPGAQLYFKFEPDDHFVSADLVWKAQIYRDGKFKEGEFLREEVTESSIYRTIPKKLESGEIIILEINALYDDGLYADNKHIEHTESQIYTFCGL